DRATTSQGAIIDGTSGGAIEEPEDTAAPLLNKIDVLDALSLNADRDSLQLSLDLLEEGEGVNSVSVVFYCTDQQVCGNVCYVWNAKEDENLKTGINEISIPLNSKLPVGVFYIDSITLWDGNNNSTTYSIKTNEGKNLLSKGYAYISASSLKEQNQAIINSFSLQKTKDLNAANDLVATLKVSDGEKRINGLRLDFYQEGTTSTVSLPLSGLKMAGSTYTVRFPMNNSFLPGTYKLKGITALFDDGYEDNYVEIEEPYLFKTSTIKVVKSAKWENNAPEITGFTQLTNSVKAPGQYSFTLDVSEEESGISTVGLVLKNRIGHEIHVAYQVPIGTDGKGLVTGTHNIDVPITPFDGVGAYSVDSVTLTDTSLNSKTFTPSENPQVFKGTTTMYIASDYNIAYSGTTSDPDALRFVSALTTGQTAVLNCKDYTTAKAEFFTAIAGKDVTLVFENDIAQWVFNGLTVDVAKCKDIILTCSISVVDGITAGFANEDKVIKMTYAANGELPGVVDMRVKSKYIIEKYGISPDNMMLSYLKDDILRSESSQVKVAGDQSIEYQVEHNSIFVISHTDASLGKPKTVAASPQGYTSIKVSWSKVGGSTGYYVYRATTKSGKYKKIATIKGADNRYYLNKSLTKGKYYYYKIKAFNAKDSKLSKTAKYSSIASAKTRLKAPTISNVSKYNSINGAIKISYTTRSDAKCYYVYRGLSSTGFFDKIGYTTKAYYVDKRAGGNYGYCYKVVAVHKSNSKLNSLKSAAKKIEY
ncbi:MAG TPA: hypothetical protein VJY37_04235, partial [Anaerovoracaceae bacterium]|nr:hypothetical protein [Anaerovoracaceae bacterium]